VESKNQNPLRVKSMSALPIRRWTIVGLLVALFSGPLVSALFTVLRIPLTAQNVLFQTAILFACAAFLLFIIRRKERLGWDSVGLQRPPQSRLRGGLCCRNLALGAADGGDKCTSIRFQAEPLVDFLQSLHPPVADSPERPFRSSAAVSTSSLALKLHRLRRLIRFAQSDNALAIEETCASLLTEALANAGEEQNMEFGKSREGTRKAHRDLVDATRVVLARRFRERLSLADLARTVFSSPFHLARIFRRETGLTLHRHQNRLRLRHALEHLADHQPDLTMLALDLGFSSRAHFSHAFRREFGCAPSHAGLRSVPACSLLELQHA
jgi:AraC-like DNA-binding protein